MVAGSSIWWLWKVAHLSNFFFNIFSTEKRRNGSRKEDLVIMEGCALGQFCGDNGCLCAWAILFFFLNISFFSLVENKLFHWEGSGDYRKLRTCAVLCFVKNISLFSLEKKKKIAGMYIWGLWRVVHFGNSFFFFKYFFFQFKKEEMVAGSEIR